LCGCVDEFQETAGDYVVKLRGALDSGGAGLINELLAAELASHFGLPTPEPAVIAVEQPLIDLIIAMHPERQAALQQSVGLNFGSKHLTGVSTWPTNKSIPEEHFVTATEIFAFDALVQNPDRGYDNPNLFTRGDGFFVYDHEAAFSFLLDVLPIGEPWEADRQRYLERHAFYKRLKSKPIELEGFIAALRRLSDEELVRIVAEVPPEWVNQRNITMIAQHIAAVRDHAEEFAEAIRRVLR
jgi:hypothetical protein